MGICRKTLAVVLLALLGVLWVHGAGARASEIVFPELPVLAEAPQNDIFTGETRKRHCFDDRDTGTELIFLGLAEVRCDYYPAEDARVPEMPAFLLPPSHSPPSL